MNEHDPIRVRRYGSRGPELVVLHGGPGAPGSAAGLARLLSDDFQVLEPLQRRAGRIPLTVAQHVEDLAAVAPVPVVLIGCSWGAMLGLSFAARYPSAVSSLVLVGCGTYDDASRAMLQDSLPQRLGEDGCRRIEELRDRLALETDQSRRDAIVGERGAVYMAAESYDRLPESLDPAEALPADEVGHTETWSDVLRLQREGIEPQAFSSISARVLMIHGDVDPHPGAATRDLLRRHIPQLEYRELERCGHEPWRERYARGPFIDLLREWLARA